MPVAPRSGCNWPGWPRCPLRAEGNSSRCAAHQAEYQRERNERRNFSKTHGSNRWKAEAKAHLEAHPWCYYCALRGQQVKATCVDHATASKGDTRIHFDRSQYRSACGPCNRRKGIEQEGGFGRARQSDEQGRDVKSPALRQTTSERPASGASAFKSVRGERARTTFRRKQQIREQS